MATCEKIEQQPVPPPPAYRLELAEDEMRALRSLFHQHLATPSDSPLGRIREALRESGAPLGRLCLRDVHCGALRFL